MSARVRAVPPWLWVAILIGVGVLAQTGWYLQKGGFLSDDWIVYSQATAGDRGLIDDVSALMTSPNVTGRPLQAWFVTIGYNVLGGHQHVWLLFVSLLACLQGFMLYLALRSIRVDVGPAAAAALLSVVMPVNASLRLWVAAGTEHVPIICALGGLALAGLAFRASSRQRALALHAASLALYVIGLLVMEVALPLMAGFGIVYLLVTRPRNALMRAVVDVAALALVYFTVTSQTNYTRRSPSEMLSALGEIANQARVLLTSRVLPFGAESWVALLVLVVLVAGAVALLHRWRHPAQRSIVILLACGLGVVIAGYVPYVVGNAYMLPLQRGINDRINCLAVVGWAMLVAGMLTALAAVLTTVWARTAGSRPRGLAPAVLAVLAALLYASYWVSFQRDARDYAGAHAQAADILRGMKEAMPTLPTGGAVIATGFAGDLPPFVPVFSQDWALTGGVQATYDDLLARGQPAVAGLAVRCGTAQGAVVVSGVERFKLPYGLLVVYDHRKRRATTLRDRKTCRRVTRTLPPLDPMPAS